MNPYATSTCSMNFHRQRFFEAASDVIIIATPDGRFEDVNPAFTISLGWSLEELAGQRILDLVHLGDCESTAAELAKLRQGVATVSFENRCRTRDKGLKRFAWTVQLVDDLFFAIGREVQKVSLVAPRPTSADSLAESDLLPNRVVYKGNPHTGAIHYEENISRLLGHDPQVLAEGFRSWRELIHPNDRTPYTQAVKENLTRQSAFHMDYRMVRKDGTEVMVQDVGQFYLDANGNVTEIVGYVTPVIGRSCPTELDRATDYYRGVAECALALNSTRSFNEIHQIITDQARLIIGAHQSVTSLTTGADFSQAVNALSLSDKYAPWRTFDAVADGSGIYAMICEMNRPVRMTQAELEAHPRWRGFGKHKHVHPPLRGWLAAPLIGRDGRNLGLMELSDKYTGDFDETDEAILVQLARMASVAMENAHLYRDIEAARETLEDNVKERTAELSQANEQLQLEIAQRERAEHRFAEVVSKLALPPQHFDLANRTFPLPSLSLTDLMLCGAAIRGMSVRNPGVEPFADELVRFLHERIVDHAGQPALALVRMFETCTFAELDNELKAIATAAYPPISPETRCLVLTATAGGEPDWNDRRRSRGHRVIPLPSEGAVQQLPMIAQLIRQLGFEVSGVLQPEGDLLLGNWARSSGKRQGNVTWPPEAPGLRTHVFHVAEAAGSVSIPAQAEFVQRFGIRSVIGYGDMLPNGRLFAVIAFSRIPVSREVAGLFSHLSLSTRLSLLPFCQTERKIEAQITTLDRLLVNYETIVSEQETRLRATLGDLTHAKDAAEIAAAWARLVVDTASDAFIVMDEQGCITDWNPEAEAIFGWPRQEILGKHLADTLIPPEFRARHQRGLEYFLATGEGPVLNQRLELVALRRNGQRFPVELTIRPIRQGEHFLFSAFLHDITPRKIAEDELRKAKIAAEEANRAKSEFLANMSHEIRTPMYAVIGMTELVLDTELTDVQKEYLSLVKGSAESLLALINDILDFSKIEAGKLELEYAPFEIREILGDTMKTLALRARQKTVEFACHISPDVPEVLQGDRLRLRQIVTNLVGNAVKFTEVGEIVLDASVEAATNKEVYLHIIVRDTGIGIPPEKQQAIFEAFSQVDASTTRRFGGTGLGLAITARLVALMEGRIWVESEVGKGSTFHFTVRFDRGEKTRTPRVTASGSLIGLRVLVADDNATNRLILQEMLSNWKMRPTVVAGASEAIAELRQAQQAGEPFQLIITDAHMPEVNGFQLVEWIKANHTLGSTVIMMLTSRDGPGDIAHCESLGIAGYLMKPIKQSEMFDAIVAAMGVAEPEEEKALEATLPGSMRPLRILLAEDSYVNQRLAVVMLTKWGHEVAIANNGREAVVKLEQDTFDLVLMDVQMPEMDGYQATAVIREREAQKGKRVPIIALTAHAMKGDREDCLAAGMDGYLSKPIRAADLGRAIEEVLGSRKVETPSGVLEKMAAPKPETILDWNAALEYVGGDREMLCEVLTALLEEWPRCLKQVEQAIQEANAPLLRRAAHTIKGDLRLFGQTRICDLTQKLEAIGKNGSCDGAADLLPLLLQETELAFREVQTFVETSGK